MVTVVDVAHNISLELSHVSASLIQSCFLFTIQQPIAKIGSTAVAKSICVVCRSTVRNAASGFCIDVAEGMCLYEY